MLQYSQVTLMKRSDAMLPSSGQQQQAAIRLTAEASRVRCQALEHLRSCRPICCICGDAVLEQGGDRRRTPAAARQVAELPAHWRRLHDQFPQDHAERKDVHLPHWHATS